MTEKRNPRARELSPRRCVGHIEREPGRLQLRFVLYPGEHMCEIDIEEDDEAVVAFASVCGPIDEDDEAVKGARFRVTSTSSARSAIAPFAMATSVALSRIATSTRSSKPSSALAPTRRVRTTLPEVRA
jgi:hypothetical protein